MGITGLTGFGWLVCSLLKVTSTEVVVKQRDLRLSSAVVTSLLLFMQTWTAELDFSIDFEFKALLLIVLGGRGGMGGGGSFSFEALSTSTDETLSSRAGDVKHL
jgi:hypothetical protein